MASATQELAQFVDDALAKGQPREAIAALQSAGWPPEQARSALAADAEEKDA